MLCDSCDCLYTLSFYLYQAMQLMDQSGVNIFSSSFLYCTQSSTIAYLKLNSIIYDQRLMICKEIVHIAPFCHKIRLAFN